jgi:hypothetical protein
VKREKLSKSQSVPGKRYSSPVEFLRRNGTAQDRWKPEQGCLIQIMPPKQI